MRRSDTRALQLHANGNPSLFRGKTAFLLSVISPTAAVRARIVHQQFPRQREDAARHFGAVRAVESQAIERSFAVHPNRAIPDAECRADLLVAETVHDERDDFRLTSRQPGERDHPLPGVGVDDRRCERRSRLGLDWPRLACGAPLAGHWRGPEQKGSAEPRTPREPPPRGMENVPWPTPPFGGAAAKALPLQLKLGGFPESSGLTLARRSDCRRGHLFGSGTAILRGERADPKRGIRSSTGAGSGPTMTARAVRR